LGFAFVAQSLVLACIQITRSQIAHVEILAGFCERGGTPVSTDKEIRVRMGKFRLMHAVWTSSRKRLVIYGCVGNTELSFGSAGETRTDACSVNPSIKSH
jgi:hypothetical protein